MSTAEARQLAVGFIEKAEGRPATVYLDKAGKPTGGHGHLILPSEAPKFPVGTPVSQAQDEQWLDQDLETACMRLAGVVDSDKLEALTDHEEAALIDFVYNCGAGHSWEIWRLINEGHLEQVPAQLIRFDKVTHKDGTTEVVRGLQNRRQAEIALWNAPDLGTACTIAEACKSPYPSSYTVAMITPPTPAPPKPLSTASLTTKAAGLVSSIGAGAAAVQTQIAPHADVAPIFHKALVVAIGVGIVCGSLGLAIHFLQQKRATQ